MQVQRTNDSATIVFITPPHEDSVYVSIGDVIHETIDENRKAVESKWVLFKHVKNTNPMRLLIKIIGTISVISDNI